ncbi:DNA-3-methyladenine glycosylase [Candidatus Saccharibacteria bacterium]|nr:MAG: DNA-3-methyladenine glycosylase [Candidatus Saccharibacteria bacterium]
MDFLQLTAPQAAAQLLGNLLISETPEGRVCGRIVEVEAYTQDDPASHTFKGHTARNNSMFQQAGTAYVYFTYGMHYCINIVTDKEGTGSGVLIRAVEPVEGIEIMWRRRYKEDMPATTARQRLLNLTNGPGKVAQAFGITREDDGVNLLDTSGIIRLESDSTTEAWRLFNTTRIGISQAKDVLWRWHTDSPYVSKTRP